MMITRIWREQPGDWFFICTKDRHDHWQDQAFASDKLHTVRDFVEANKDKNIYACPHGFSWPRRLKEYAVLPKLLYADLDDADPHDMDLEPTIALESSPGRYVGLWQTDRPITEELNKRLSYHVGADAGGWDLTQVLRLVPRTTNYKYSYKPEVKLLWRDGPTYRVRDLRRELPELEATGKLAPPKRTFTGDIRKLAARFRVSAKMRVRPTATDRSSLIWYLGMLVLEQNGSVDEALAIVMHSAAFKLKYEDDPRAAAREIERLRTKWAVVRLSSIIE